MCVALCVLDWELFRSMGGEVAALSELLDVLAVFAVFPAPFAAESVSMVTNCWV